jgi:hypothetical protein
MAWSMHSSHDEGFNKARRISMPPNNEDRHATEAPFAELERQLIGAYLAGAGQDFAELIGRPDSEARRLLADASAYASLKLSEVDARLRYLRSLQGG